ncbi:MAG TPA: hypothetical protein VIQ26_07805 [Microbacteriaceae bacterium]
MKKVSYAGLAFLTADDVADALVDLAAALPRAEIVEVPIVDDRGTIQRARLVIGPTSHLIAVPEDTAFADPEDDGTTGQLRKRASLVRSPHTAIATATEPLSASFEELEFP